MSTSIDEIIRNLESIHNTLDTFEFREIQHNATPTELVALNEAFFGFFFLLDSSVSAQGLGSGLDSKEQSAWNLSRKQMADQQRVIETFLSTNGTSTLNAPGIAALAWEGEKVIIVRDCHISVIHSLQFSGASPHWVVPPLSDRWGITFPITPDELDDVLAEHQDSKGVVVTSPSYFGLTSDIEGLSSVCRKWKVPLYVDSAWGPQYFATSSLGFPPAPQSQGADVTTSSVHKMATCLSQGALLNFMNQKLVNRFSELFRIFVSSSPSYPIAISVEHAINELAERGTELWTGAVEITKWLRDQIRKIDGFDVLDNEIVDGIRVKHLDPVRLAIRVTRRGITGFEAARILKEQADIDVELATRDLLLFLFAPPDSKQDAEYLLSALKKLPYSTPLGKSRLTATFPEDRPLTPRQVLSLRKRRRVPLSRASGKICAEVLASYPPGIPCCVPGERLTEELLTYLEHIFQDGAHITRTFPEDNGQFTSVVVLDE
ncbi:aminotransferase class I/II-fold pyridoxal phosphate-dependent enzyme [Gimesia panareensis]|uniref:aminotransferase class I/II-fold pyridoxal phosphate-dependent enzyme n=1 Tax=Gimesia panareensis TaxID=2527978 RepID=UPI00118BC5E3|nr:hypothetical protein [Gimesia panareensis]QDU52954.1 Arginine decarboxylase [Gimesia panareensis]